MKKLITSLIIAVMSLMVSPLNINAQLLRKLGQQLENSVEKQLEIAMDSSKKKQAQTTGDIKSTYPSSANKQDNRFGETSYSEGTKSYVSSYTSKFDFVPGEKLIISDDFSQDAVGDFPALWFTNGSGEVVTIDGQEGKWLMIKGRSKVYLDSLLDLPDNFTVQFDLLCSVPFSWSSDVFNLYMEDVIDLARYRKGDNGGEMSSRNINYHFWLDLHPGVYNPGTYTTKGYGNYRFNEARGKLDLNEIWMPGAEKRMLKVSIWRQGQRLRLYLNENKIIDLQKIIPEDMNPNLFVFEPYRLEDGDNYFIGNLRIAVGNPDTRNKFLEEGKVVTNGILFGVNSDKIKPESYGILKEIAGILKESGDITVTIVGHTDSDGDDAKNLELSKKRAESVMNALSKDFGINQVRMKTDGKGETEPLEPNTGAIMKANNRRVEFLKTDG